MTDLTTTTTGDLITELMSRLDHGVLVGAFMPNITPDADGQTTYMVIDPKIRGNAFVVLGLIEHVKAELIAELRKASKNP